MSGGDGDGDAYGSAIAGGPPGALAEAALALAVAVVVLGGCGTSPAAAVEMTTGTHFAPSSVQVERGAVVAWHNNGAEPHSVTADPSLARDPAHVLLPDGAQPWDSGDLEVAGTFEQRFDVPGRYVYVCRIHEADGMVATVEVLP